MIFNHDCTRHGHRFEPRYDEEPGQLKIDGGAGGLSADAALELLQATRTKTYVCDVCIRCGEVVKRPDKLLKLEEVE